MTTTILIALGLTLLLYLTVALLRFGRAKTLSAMIPLTGDAPHVERADEFSTNTIATTISLATVVLAVFELMPYLKLWLLWTAVTTATGLWLVKRMAGKIWDTMQNKPARPSLHEFLGTVYESPAITLIGAVFTCVGFLGALAVELTVGSRFLATLVGQSPFVWLVLLSTVVFVLVGLGGYRAMVITERFQMVCIYAFLGTMGLFIVIYLLRHAGTPQAIPVPAPLFPLDTGLASFLVGILCINVPAYLSDMSVWQRIAASRSRTVVEQGLQASWVGSAVTWTWIVLLALGTLMTVPIVEGTNPLFSFAVKVEQGTGVWRHLLIGLVVIGLLGAMISTASTQLMASSHAFYEDIYRRLAGKTDARLSDPKETGALRLFIAGLIGVAVVIVEGLGRLGFSISDLVFAVFGAQLSLFPPVLLGLCRPGASFSAVKSYVIAAVAGGFVAGWGGAIAGKLVQNGDLVFLAPVVSLGVSAAILGLGCLIHRHGLDSTPANLRS